MIDLVGYGAFFLVNALIFGVICLGLNLQWGQTGLFNVGVAGFVAIGAYTSAILTTPETADRIGGFDWPILAGWLAAMLLAGGAAALIGLATLRLRADYLAMTTFGIAVTIQVIALNATGLTGGPFGIAFIPRPFSGLAETPIAFNAANLALTGAVTLGLFLLLEMLTRSPFGRVLRAIREDEAAAASLGKSVNFYRLQAFALGGAIMGLAGAMQAHFIGFIAPDNYLSILTFQAWAMLIVGGSGNNRGALIGAVVVWGLWSLSSLAVGSFVAPAFQARAAALQIVAIGVALAAILIIRPRGLIGERAIVSRDVEAIAGEAGADEAVRD
ncbi:branched-chain amino acid ABC transporter permease [Kaistia algarum]|uniref:branched-chain amino acid ABC transporter permease n=1 Tax=Kaistia algarum TaxID=2083279 RepID=UPI000CE8B21B|nr:branched-chain amino acid ABC transporter permease [Kaistia algarum]MCX5515051.1 branched-chain amino acid ABC transporter permease [Kaistia algarum]PPE79785.1 branched-chain amino acid ABC transporter permease [Kaistia algarum]